MLIRDELIFCNPSNVERREDMKIPNYHLSAVPVHTFTPTRCTADRNCTVVSTAIEDRRVIAETVGRVIVASDELGITERFERYNTFFGFS